MKELINVNEIAEAIREAFEDIKVCFTEPLIMEPFYKDFKYSFCWSSNAIEGNTLSLEDTISFLEYDEVRSGHTFSEYEEAKHLNKAIERFLRPEGRQIDEDWIQDVNSVIIDAEKGYRKENVFIGSMIEAVYYPPHFEKIPELMETFLKKINFSADNPDEIIRQSVLRHIEFERIHPFSDGNGRTGRMILNQGLINNGLLPVLIGPKSKYRQAFKQYDKNQDVSLMEFIIYKEELNSLEKVKQLSKKLNQSLTKSTLSRF